MAIKKSSLEEMKQYFKLGDINKAASAFNTDKLVVVEPTLYKESCPRIWQHAYNGTWTIKN